MRQLYPDIYHDFVLSTSTIESLRTVRPEVSQSEEIALTILDDLLDRRGYRQEFDEFAEDIQNEVLNDWIGIIDSCITPFSMVQGILSDVRQRSGWDDIYDSVDEDITADMIKTWENKVVNILKPESQIPQS